ncbi:hypothetical protein EV421DRAFT_1157685 [Armillaria borealis]|uniref:Uncharacterized protein n=1 Tax=Armillaria borealis TaxID=47425 RepID=A0AA39J4B6_9AGAR|nr:hypothetical protein EV421DRAFT_1157685 [Armillaria borealis]
MATQLDMDFSIPNPHLYQGPEDRLPPDWSNDWKRFPSRRRLFPLVNGRVFSSIFIEAHNHVFGDIYVIMYHDMSDETVVRIGTRYFMYNFETDVLLEFIDTYPTLDAFLELARQWGSPACQTYDMLTPLVEREEDETTEDYYDRVKLWDEEVDSARAAHALMNSRSLCSL